MEGICRLCLEENSVMTLLFENNDLPIRINECVQLHIEKDDNLPSYICSDCLQIINTWFSFREVCYKSNKFLLNFKQKCKNETKSNIVPSIKIEINKNISKNEDINKLEVNKKAVTTNDELISNHSEEEYEIEYIECAEFLENDNILVAKNKELNSDINNLNYQPIINLLDLKNQKSYNGEKVFKCRKCEKVFESNKELCKHVKDHSKNPCEVCGKMMLPSSMKMHLLYHTDKYKCPHCDARFSSEVNYRNHINSVHLRIKAHTCEICGKSYPCKQNLDLHLKTHSDKREYSCNLCNYSGRTYTALYAHRTIHMNESHKCEICNKIYKSHRHLKNHEATIHKNVEKKHECSFCNKKFAKKDKLTIHMRIHTGIKPYECDICGKAFSRNDALKEHILIHGNRQNFICPECGKTFANRRSLKKHSCNS